MVWQSVRLTHSGKFPPPKDAQSSTRPDLASRNSFFLFFCLLLLFLLLSSFIPFPTFSHLCSAFLLVVQSPLHVLSTKPCFISTEQDSDEMAQSGAHGFQTSFRQRLAQQLSSSCSFLSRLALDLIPSSLQDCIPPVWYSAMPIILAVTCEDKVVGVEAEQVPEKSHRPDLQKHWRN